MPIREKGWEVTVPWLFSLSIATWDSSIIPILQIEGLEQTASYKLELVTGLLGTGWLLSSVGALAFHRPLGESISVLFFLTLWSSVLTCVALSDSTLCLGPVLQATHSVM